VPPPRRVIEPDAVEEEHVALAREAADGRRGLPARRLLHQDARLLAQRLRDQLIRPSVDLGAARH
jgi:hypothetical protein